MADKKKASESSLAGIKPVAVIRKRERRPLLVDEMEFLLSWLWNGPERYGMTGQERGLLYILAVETGFRAGSLRSLKRSSFDLTASPATVRMRATNTKSKKEMLLPLRKATVEELRKHLATKTPSAPAFNIPDSDETAAMIKADLDNARVDWIKQAQTLDDRAAREGGDFLCYVNHAGYVADFHALRGTCGTNLDNAGAPLTTTQKILGHSTTDLTANFYIRRRLVEQAETLEALPSLTEAIRPQQLEATGTDSKASTSGRART